MPRTHHRILPKRTRGRLHVESSHVDTTSVPETDVYDFDDSSDSSRCRAGDGDDDVLRSPANDHRQPVHRGGHAGHSRSTATARHGAEEPAGGFRRRKALKRDSLNQAGTVQSEGYSARLASIAATLREQLHLRPRVHNVRPTVLSRRDRLVSFARRNNTNLFTTCVAVTTVLLLLPLCVLYYKAGTMAAGMHQKGMLFPNGSLSISIQRASTQQLARTSIRWWTASAVHASPPSVDTEGFVPYRTKVVSTNPIFCVYQHDVFLRFPKLHYRVVDVPGAFCTHLIYHAAGVTADGSIYRKDPTFDETYQAGQPVLKLTVNLRNWENSPSNLYSQAAELKGVYTHLKVLLTLGGGPDERDTFQFSSVTGLLNRTRAFADKAYWWLVNRGFDGLHLDWRQPGGHCGSPGDKQNFLVLIETLRERFGLRYIITVGVPYQEEYRHRGYHLPGIADQADFLLATTHGFHDASEKYAQCPSPYTTPFKNHTTGRSKIKAPGNSPTMHEVMRALKYEVPREHRQRLCFSVSLMGHRWTLRSSGSFHTGSAASRAGPAAGDSQARGVLEYPLVCQYLLRDSVDPDGMCSYAVRFRDWVAYEGVQSLPIKLSRMRRDMGTPGLCVAVWDLAFDDFRGDCGNSRSPLLRAIHKALSSRKVFVIPKGAVAGKRP
ncbi:hypothetical protein MRX96_052187 [Rhipicephalus microplus]